MDKKRQKCEVYSRVVGYLRPVSQWNEGKVEEFAQRKEYDRQVKPTGCERRVKDGAAA